MPYGYERCQNCEYYDLCRDDGCISCPDCEGTGNDDYDICSLCNGEGEFPCPVENGGELRTVNGYSADDDSADDDSGTYEEPSPSVSGRSTKETEIKLPVSQYDLVYIARHDSNPSVREAAKRRLGK